MLATATLAGMARVGRIDPLSGHAVHDGSTEVGCTVGLGQTWVDPLDQLRHRPLAVVPQRYEAAAGRRE